MHFRHVLFLPNVVLLLRFSRCFRRYLPLSRCLTLATPPSPLSSPCLCLFQSPAARPLAVVVRLHVAPATFLASPASFPTVTSVISGCEYSVEVFLLYSSCRYLFVCIAVILLLRGDRVRCYWYEEVSRVSTNVAARSQKHLRRSVRAPPRLSRQTSRPHASRLASLALSKWCTSIPGTRV